MKSIVRIEAGVPLYNHSDYVNARSLAAGVAESTTVPADARYVNISSNVDIFVTFVDAATATIPGDVTDGTACVLNPSQRTVIPGHTISVISASAGIVTFEFYAGV